MVKEYLNGRMEMFMKGNLKIMINMDMVYYVMKTEMFMMEIGLII